jgi:hypothetical protein
MENIIIKYDGDYPNLCSGKLIVIVDGKEWIFPDWCLSSGGSVWFSDDWEEHVEEGAWTITNWPKKFPDDLKDKVERRVNEEIPHGCCGGCV